MESVFCTGMTCASHSPSSLSVHLFYSSFFWPQFLLFLVNRTSFGEVLHTTSAGDRIILCHIQALFGLCLTSILLGAYFPSIIAPNTKTKRDYFSVHITRTPLEQEEPCKYQNGWAVDDPYQKVATIQSCVSDKPLMTTLLMLKPDLNDKVSQFTGLSAQQTKIKPALRRSTILTQTCQQLLRDLKIFIYQKSNALLLDQRSILFTSTHTLIVCPVGIKVRYDWH